MKLSAFAAALLATAAVATAASAQIEGVAACTTEDAVYQRDLTIVDESIDAFDKGDFPAVKAHIKGLEEVLSHAPEKINHIELCGETVVLREFSKENATATVNRVLTGEDRKRKVDWRPSPYSRASMMVGSFYVETEDFVAAEKALSVGLRLEPLHPSLASETALAMGQLGRQEQSLALVDRVLAENTALDVRDRARLLRTRGYMLVELKRLDEAEAAYRESLKLQPDNKVALGELDYIARARAGAPPTGLQVLRSETGEPSPEKVKP